MLSKLTQLRPKICDVLSLAMICHFSSSHKLKTIKHCAERCALQAEAKAHSETLQKDCYQFSLIIIPKTRTSLSNGRRQHCYSIFFPPCLLLLCISYGLWSFISILRIECISASKGAIWILSILRSATEKYKFGAYFVSQGNIVMQSQQNSFISKIVFSMISNIVT